MPQSQDSLTSIKLGLKENWLQFAILVLVNAFVGGMVGLERTVVPLIGSEEFKIASTTVVASFIASFGLSKAFTNLLSGELADAWGRKKTLVLGWLVGLPVPFLIIWAPSWSWIVAANVLLGISQGLAWSMCVIMKVDLVGPKSRGLAVGLNEFAGYFMVGLTAFATGWLASEYGALRPEPFYLGIGYAVLGLVLSIFFVRDTIHHVKLEASNHVHAGNASFKDVFWKTSLRDRNLFAASQAGLVNNLNDGMNWAIFPLFFIARGLGVEPIGVIKAVYPGVWGVMQTITGPISDRIGRKWLIVAGMWLQAVALFMVPIFTGFKWWLFSSVLLGIGTAMVYPTLIASVSDASHPTWRARSLSIYRFWRDLGYAIGALLAGVLGDLLGLSWAIAGVGFLTFVSGGIVAVCMRREPVSTTSSEHGSAVPLEE